MTNRPRGSSSQAVIVTLVIIGVCVLVGTLVAKVRAKRSDVIVLKLAHCLDTTHCVHKSMEYMGKLLEEKSGGKVQMEIFPNAQLGSERETIELLQLGCIDVTKVSTATMENFVTPMKVFGLPYLFRDGDHFWKTLNSDLGRELAQSGRDVGLRGLCYYDSGSRSFYSKAKAIMTPDDLIGMKVRVMDSPVALQLIETLGGNPQAIPFGELYTALQQGVVDAAENNPPSFYTSRHYEVCPHYVLDEHTSIPDILIISQVKWDGFSPQMRQWIQEAADESSIYQRDLWEKQTQESLDKVKEAGVTVYKPEKQPFQDKVAPMYDEYRGIKLELESAKTMGGLIDNIREVK